MLGLFDESDKTRRFRCIELLRLKASLLGRDIESLKSVDCFKKYDKIISNFTSEWFTLFNKFFDSLSSSTDSLEV